MLRNVCVERRKATWRPCCITSILFFPILVAENKGLLHLNLRNLHWGSNTYPAIIV